MKATILLAIALTLTACTEQEQRRAAVRESAGGYPLRVLVDPQTGCQYLTAYEKGITPRLSRTGQHICSLQEPRSDG